MELIDKYSLVGQDGLFSKRGCYSNCQHCGLWSSEGCRVILEAPTVDAKEVVYGRWVDKEDYYIETGVTCSICGERYWFETSRIDFEPYNYCPNCGADMRERKNND